MSLKRLKHINEQGLVLCTACNTYKAVPAFTYNARNYNRENCCYKCKDCCKKSYIKRMKLNKEKKKDHTKIDLCINYGSEIYC